MPQPYYYQWKPNDTVLSIAGAYNLSPQALIQANQGNLPASTGATIKIPFQRQVGMMPGYKPSSGNVLTPQSLAPAQPVMGGKANPFGEGSIPRTSVSMNENLFAKPQPYTGAAPRSTLAPDSIEMLNWQDRLTASTAQTTIGGPDYPTGQNDIGATVHVDDGSKNGVDVKNYFTPQDLAYFAAFSGQSRAQALDTLKKSGYVQYGGMMVYNPGSTTQSYGWGGNVPYSMMGGSKGPDKKKPRPMQVVGVSALDWRVGTG